MTENPEHTLAHGLLANIRETTPGGISLSQLTRRRPKRIAMTYFAWLVFGALLIAGALVWISR